ncbi:MAG: hypothetical protein WCK47_02485 [bacterium]
MTELRLENFTMPGVDLGPESPLPSLPAPSGASGVVVEDSIPKFERASFAAGQTRNRLPYLDQDGYTRERKPRAFR